MKTRTIESFVDRDLGALAEKGELEPAFEVDPILDVLRQYLRSARAAPTEYRRFPLLVGESGVGKTAVLRELARRSPPELDHRGVVSIDLGAIASRGKDYASARAELEAAMSALAASAGDVLALFQGLALVSLYNLVPRFLALLGEPGLLVAAELRPADHRNLVENVPALSSKFLPIVIEEPSAERLEALLVAWAAHRAKRLGVDVTDEAIEVGMELTDRLLPGHRQPRKSIDLLAATAAAAPGKPVTAERVVDWFATLHAVPRFLVSPDEPLDLGETEAFFRDRLIGQDEAIDAVVRMISTVKAGLSDLRRPLGAFLFAGPTGVGKTHIAQLLATYLFGSPHAMLRVNMPDFASPHSAADLFGDPAGETTLALRGVLAQRLVVQPFGVLLLDELEKAYPLVHDRLLQLVDEGRYLDGNGDAVHCSGLVVIATTNAGSEVFRQKSIGFLDPGDEAELVRQMMREVEVRFRFEFLNRFDRIVAFRPLRRAEIRELARREIARLLERSGLRRRRLSVEVDEGVLDLLAALGYDPLYGARFLRREIERRVVGAISDPLVRRQPPPGSRVRIRARGSDVAVSVEPPPDRPQRVSTPTAKGDRVERLDRTALRERAAALLSAQPYVERTLADARGEMDRYLAATTVADFWDDPQSARRTLEAYRTAELLAESAQRVLRALEVLGEPIKRPTTDAFARAIERAAHSMEHFRDLTVPGGPVWVVLGPADAIRTEPQLVRQFADMYRAWGRSCAVDTEAVAEEVDPRGNLVRAVLLAEAPSARTIFEMERGLHRVAVRRKDGAMTGRVSVDVVPLGPDGPVSRADVSLADLRHGPGVVVKFVTARAALDLGDRGLRFDLRGVDRETLGALARDLRAAPAPPSDVARVYNEGGTGARDPRTGAVSARVRDVFAGDLSKFLAAWRAARQSGFIQSA